ncbi:MAG: hypothetical protein ACO1N9_02650 [Flavobacterium sp.]
MIAKLKSLLLILTLLSCSDRKPYEEEFYEDPKLLTYIRIAKNTRALSLYDVDGHLSVSLHERLSKKSDTLTMELTDAQMASFNKIVKQQLNPNTFIAAKDTKKEYEVTFVSTDIDNEMIGSYQSSNNFNDISLEFGRFMKVIYQNPQIKDFLEDENTK